ncbi:MAG: protein kinase [Candidatus Eremiobacterota bacterium]
MNTASLETVIIKKRYKLIKTLGTGGMGSVYLAHDMEKNMSVSIKEMHKISDPVERAKDIGQFGKEAKFLTKLSHPNLPRLYEFFFEDERPYLVMEYIEGKTLEAIMEENTHPAKEEQILQWAIELCEVLHYLHSQTPQIIFRDLKLSNIMLDKKGKIKLIDFGIAREFNPRKDTDTIRMGSVGYAPMEQYAKGGQTDVRTDIYALGVCLHTLLTKNDPATTPFSFQDVYKYNPSVSRSMNNIIMKALDIKPEKRFQSVMELLEKLKEELPLPLIKITPDFIDGGDIIYGEKKKVSAIITNIRKGLLSGTLKEEPLKGIEVSVKKFENNYHELTLEINSSDFEPDKEYRERVIFTSTGGDGHIDIYFKIVLSKIRLETDVSFLDLGTLKYERETCQEITVYNSGGGTLTGKISSSQEWLIFTPDTFTSNEEKIKISVKKDRLPEGSLHEGIINIESNGGNMNINTVLFRPVAEIFPHEIDLKVTAGKNINIPLTIINKGRGFLKGTICSNSSWIKLSSHIISGNINYLNMSIESSELKKGKKYSSTIELDGNCGKCSVPVFIEPYSIMKTFLKCCFILLISLMIVVSVYIRYTIEETNRINFLNRLSNIHSQIAYVTDLNGFGTICLINPDGTDKKLTGKGYFSGWSRDGKKFICSSPEGVFHIVNINERIYEESMKGINPVWSRDGKKIACQKNGDIIQIIDMETHKSISLIYGQYPSWNSSGEKLVYTDRTSESSSIKMISIKNPVPEVLGDGFNPLWSPAEHYIVCNQDSRTLCIIRPDMPSWKKTFPGTEPAWSFSGKKIAFQRDGIIYIFDTETEKEKKITEGYEPSWSPDESYLAFSMNGIYVIELSTGMAGRIAEEGYKPVWSREQ